LPKPQLREFGVGAQILGDLGIREMILLTNTPKSMIGLEGYHLSIVENRPIKFDRDHKLPVRDKFYDS